MVLDGKVKIQDEDYDAQLYEMTIDYLTENNLIQYEVSNFAKNGFECKHNHAYWRYKDYLSFGTSAHSFVNGIRWWNYSSLNFYIDAINKKGNAIIGKEILSDEQIFE
jgi:oxygen-independent coproporphyrinogen-3 oxidase